MKKAAGMSASELFSQGIPSEARQHGRRLVLMFRSFEMPELDRIEFHATDSKSYEFRQLEHEDKDKRFKSSKVSKALPVFFLDYLCARLQNPPRKFLFEGGPDTLAAALGNALNDKNGVWGSLFVEFLPQGGKANRVEKIFGGKNWAGRPENYRIITVKQDYLPVDCIEVFWNDRLVGQLDEIQKLTGQFRKAWSLPPPPELEIEKGKASDPVKDPPISQPSPPAGQQQTGQQEAKKPATDDKTEPKADFVAGKFKFEFKPPPKPITIPDAPPTIIDPKLFEITNPDEIEWDDSDPLINFGYENSTADVWTIRDASEGVMIFGAIGSGKTSSTGTMLATSFLNAGYGGLVMTAKSDEAMRWKRLCEKNGRAEDCILIAPGCEHRLNVLQYEIQRPGKRVSVADDLTAMLRCINAVASQSKANEEGDRFWTLAPNMLMKNLFEMFVIAKEPIAISNFTRFINRAPDTPDKPWQGLEYFSNVVGRAEKNARAGSDQDKEMFLKSFDYWTQTFPKMPDITRGGIVASFESMAEILTGRGIRELLCTDTTLTPEMILSGKIVILDFPVKESSQANLMVQATWKLLFQQAIERRSDKNLATARPVFLWEDEGHEFFSQHDVRFQPTARDCRASHVIISQNLHNFFRLGHGKEAVEAVLGAINTFIFHTNGDNDTNVWASNKIGVETGKHLTTGGLMKGFTEEDYSLNKPGPRDTRSIGDLSITRKYEPAMRPEEFGKLKRGGDGTCEAVILWLAHQFEVNKKKNFCKRTFNQAPR